VGKRWVRGAGALAALGRKFEGIAGSGSFCLVKRDVEPVRLCVSPNVRDNHDRLGSI
jgi:hypothetical protein